MIWILLIVGAIVLWSYIDWRENKLLSMYDKLNDD